VVSDDGSAPTREKKRRWIIAGAAAVFLLGSALGARALVLRAAVRASVATVDSIADGLPEGSESKNAEEDLFFPLWPLKLPEDGSPLAPLPPPETFEEPPEANEGGTKKTSKRSYKPSPMSARASVERVLQWAELQLVPRGITREARGGMPAGIDLYGVGSLGVGLLDGDRLLTVDGVSVLERGQVVGAVLGARSRKAESMTAGLARWTAKGVERFSVVVAQPYPEHIPLEEEPPAQDAPEPPQ
jgi:hypothetical protein